MNQASSCQDPKYPRPSFVRTEWLCLDGEWEFEYDDLLCGERRGGTCARSRVGSRCRLRISARKVESGEAEAHSCVWYRHTFSLPAQRTGRRWLLHFGAVDYACTVWFNGKFTGSHQGGHVPFYFDVTDLAVPGENVISVKVEDRFLREQPRGKQAPSLPPDRCWYTNTTGIWQSVWLEPVRKPIWKSADYTGYRYTDGIH